MPSYSPELIQVMRAALDDAVTRLPIDHVTPAIKAQIAEVILKAAAEGQTTHDGLVAAVASQMQTILAMLT